MNNSFFCTALLGTNKAGTLKPDADGYYRVVLGALDVFNSGGAFYPEASARRLFEQSASLMRRIASGNLRGEYGHPRPQPGQTMDDFINRVRDIYEPNICMHIRKVEIDYTFRDPKTNAQMIAIIGEVRPSGPRGPALKEQLDNRFEDVCFSIRSLTNDSMNAQGRTIKNIRMIVTWDYVNEPGLDVARKWNAPGLESISDAEHVEVPVLPEMLHAMLAAQKRSGMSASMENSGSVSLESILEAVEEPEVVPNAPNWTKW